MNLVKCKFLDENKKPKGREYTYASKVELVVGEIVSTQDDKEVLVTETHVPEEAISGIVDRIKYVSRHAPQDIEVENISIDEISIIPKRDSQMQELITIEQLPVIKERLAILSEGIDADIAYALSLDCTEETVKTVKTLRAKLNKDKDFWETQRKNVEMAIFTPYEEQFKKPYKQYVSDKYKLADAQLKTKIDEVENERKRQKYEDVKAYFDEYRLSLGVDFVNMDTWNPNITLSVSEKALKEEAKTFIDRICRDIALIETQQHNTEILVEYRRSLDVSQAITSVITRHRAIEDQKARQAEIETRKSAEQAAVKNIDVAAQIIAPPTANPVIQMPPVPKEQTGTIAFKVSAPISKLRELKQFLTNNGYQYEQVPLKNIIESEAM